MAVWPQCTSHPPQEHKTRVRIPPGKKKVFRENIAMLLGIVDLICIVCVLKKEIQAMAQNISKTKKLKNAKKYFERFFKKQLLPTNFGVKVRDLTNTVELNFFRIHATLAPISASILTPAF
jgi:DNA-binding transcriptional regulator/RsmH inhibitor MraZ